MSQNAEVSEDYERAVTPLREWIAEVTGLPVVDEWSAGDEAAAVLVRPLSIAMAPATARVPRHVSSSEVTLTVLVSTVGSSADKAAALTTGLALSLAADGRWTIGAEVPDAALWQALGQPPVPAFTLQVPVRRVVEREVPLVREPLRFTAVGMRVVTGRVVWADGRPIAAARVQLAGQSAPPATTDHRGRFRLSTPVADGKPLRLQVAARSVTEDLVLDHPGADAAGDLGDLSISIPESV